MTAKTVVRIASLTLRIGNAARPSIAKSTAPTVFAASNSAASKKSPSAPQQRTLLSPRANPSAGLVSTFDKPQQRESALAAMQGLAKSNNKAMLEKERSTDDNQSPSRTNDSIPTTRYGTVAIALPDESSDIYKTVAKLPEDFPGNEWDSMTAEQQRSELKQTDLTAQEQWLLLNVNLPVGALQEVQRIRADDGTGWASQEQREELIAKFWEASTAIYFVQNNMHPLSYDRAAGKILSDLIETDIEKILDEAVPRQKEQLRRAEYLSSQSLTGTEEYIGGNAGILVDNDPSVIRDAFDQLSLNEKMGNTSSYKIDENGALQKNTINILYTSGKNTNFSRQANYQKRLLEKQGYHVVMHKVNSVEEFTKAWDNMDESTKAAMVFVHSNGDSLIFEDGSPTNAMSWSGMNSHNAPIGDIRNLRGPQIDELYLMSCNSANEMLMHYQNANVADAFRDLDNVKTVYGYDGSMGYGKERINVVSPILYPRLSRSQERFEGIMDYYDEELRGDPLYQRLTTPDGWFRYES